MPRVELNLNKAADRAKVKGEWRQALGYIPGEPTQGLVAEVESSPARLPEYDDSAWEVCDNIRLFVSKGLAIGWWRITVELPESLEDVPIAGSTVVFETNIDDYGEVWVDGEIDKQNGTIAGWNRPQRVVV